MTESTEQQNLIRFAEQYGNGLPIDVCVRFDKKFNKDLRNNTKTEKFLPMEMKQFIAKELETAKTLLQSQLRKEIEGLRVTYEGVKDKQVTPVEASHLGFFNRAIDEVLNLLQETK